MDNIADLRFLKDLNITVVPGTSLYIEVQDFTAVNNQFYTLWIGQFLPEVVGTEQVFIQQIGSLVNVPVIDRSGNIVRAGQLRGARVTGGGCNGHLRPSRYRLRYGSDGLPTGGSPIYVVWEGLCPMIYNGAASLATDPGVDGASATLPVATDATAKADAKTKS